MATVDMGASTQQGKNNTKPTLAAKPPMALLATHLSVLRFRSRSPSPDASKSCEKRPGNELERKLQLTRNDIDGRSICPHTIAGECESRPGNILVNIHTVNTLRQGRRKAKKPPKPLPYLVPISSYTVREGRHLFAGGPTDRLRKRVTFAKYQRVRHRRASTKINSSRLPKGSELAYLVVDLETGTLSYSADDFCRPRSESVGEKGEHLDSKRSPSRLRAMSVIAHARPKPKPLPRRRSGISPAENRDTPPETAKKETTQVEMKSSAHEYQVTSPTSCDECTQDGDSPVTKQQTVANDKDSSPLKDDVLIPIPRKRSVCNTYTRTERPAVPPPTTNGSDRTSPQADKPPPLPAKSELSRKIQQSIKLQAHKPPKEYVAEPYETPVKIELEEIDTHQNDSYGAPDDDFSDYDNSGPLDVSADKPEELYIDPAKSSQLSSSGKPKPPRPPPPTISAIRRAQQKKTQSLGVRKPVKSGGKALTKQQSNPITHRVNRKHSSATVSRQTTIHTTNSTPLPIEIPGDYEELDCNDDTSGLPADTLWKPPPSLPSPNSRRRFLSETEITAPAPALPPKSDKPSATKSVQRMRREGPSPVPSGFSRSTSDNLHKVAETKVHTSTDTGRRDSDEQNDAWDDDSVYEPVDVSMPLAPQRTKKHIKGTRTTQDEGRPSRRPPPLAPTQLSKSGTAPRLSNSLRSRKPALRTSASLSSQKTVTRSVPASGDMRKGKGTHLSTLSKKDEGGTEEYVEIHCKLEWSDTDSMPDEYVDMHPVRDETEDGPCMGPYASSDILSSRPDLKHTH